MPTRLTALLLLVAASLCAQAADVGAMELIQKLEEKCRGVRKESTLRAALRAVGLK